MRYFRHSELADKYHVSLKTVHNWIDAAKRGGVDLKLHKVNRFTYIADTPENDLILRQLADKGKKYRNTLHHKIVSPKPEFYEIFSRRQILDIITNLNVHGEIPRQYNYLKDGATNWDNWVKRLDAEGTPSMLKGTEELIKMNLDSIDRLIEGKKKVNLIDLGMGNAYPAKSIVGHLVSRGLLHRYIAIDISQSMLDIAKQNIQDWYGDTVQFEGHIRDMTHEQFDDLLVDDMLNYDADDVVNIVLLLGDTPLNFRFFTDVFKPIFNSIGRNDLLLYTGKPDNEASRRYFDFGTGTNKSKVSASHKYILDLMNIDESLYEAEMGFDSGTRMRYVRVRLVSALTLDFVFDEVKRSVTLEKGDTILLLRVWHLSALEIITQFQRSGFTLLQSSLTKDRQFFLSISGVEARSGSGGR